MSNWGGKKFERVGLVRHESDDHARREADVDPFSKLPDTPQRPQNGSIFLILNMLAAESSLSAYCRGAAVRAKGAAMELAQLSGERKNAWLQESAKVLRERTAELLAENEKDVAAAPGYGLTDAAVDRLKLTTGRIEEIAVGLEAVAALPDPVGEVIESSIRPNGDRLRHLR